MRSKARYVSTPLASESAAASVKFVIRGVTARLMLLKRRTRVSD